MISIIFFSYMTQVWEQQKILLLNDPKVISAALQKLKFPKENFESCLSFTFSAKITENEASSWCVDVSVWGGCDVFAVYCYGKN